VAVVVEEGAEAAPAPAIRTLGADAVRQRQKAQRRGRSVR